MDKEIRSRRGMSATGCADSPERLLNVQALIEVPVLADGRLGQRIDKACRYLKIRTENGANALAQLPERDVATLATILRVDQKASAKPQNLLKHLELANTFQSMSL